MLGRADLVPSAGDLRIAAEPPPANSAGGAATSAGSDRRSSLHLQVRLTPRLSCGARAPQRFRPRPPARRLLQPVVRPPVPEGQLFAIVNCSLDLVTTCTFGLPHRARLRTHRFLAHE